MTGVGNNLVAKEKRGGREVKREYGKEKKVKIECLMTVRKRS